MDRIVHCRWKQIYKIIEESMPDGIDADTIIKRLETTKSSLYSHVNLINQKDDLNKIKNIDGKYVFVDNYEKRPFNYRKNKNSNTNTNTSLSIYSNNNPQFIPKSLLNYISELSESDRHDFNDMIKKSYFYGKSAIALLEAYKITSQL